MDREEFGRRIKNKFPQYNNLSDGEVADLVVKRYPEYREVISGAPEERKTALQRTAGVFDAIFGGGTIGEAIGTGIAKSGLTGLSEEERKNVSKGPSLKSLAGDVVSTAAGVLPFTKAGSAALSAGRLGSRVAKGAALGTTIATGEAVEQGGPLSPAAIGGAAVGAAVPAAGAATRAIGRGIQGLPERLVRSATGQSKAQLLKGKDVTPKVLREKRIGSARQLIKQADESIESLNKKIARRINRSKETTNVNTARLFTGVQNSPAFRNSGLGAEELRERLASFAPQVKGLVNKQQLTLKEANTLRQALDRSVKSSGFLTDQQLSFGRELAKRYSNNLRRIVQRRSRTESLFDELELEINLSNALTEKITQGSRNQVVSFGDLIGGGVGGFLGGGVTGGVAGIAGRRALQSTPTLTALGVSIDQLDRIMQPIFEQLNPAARGLLIDIMSRLIGENVSTPDSDQ